MTIQNKDSLLASSERGHDAVKTALAAGGLVAAFGVASCCALPVALSLLGISAASLVGIGYLAAQYQQELFYAAVICLGAALSSCCGNEGRGCVHPVRHALVPCLTGAVRLPSSSRSDCSCSPFGSSPRYERRSSVYANLSELRRLQGRDHADQRVPVLLRMHDLHDAAQAQARRLLRVLLLRVGTMSTDPRRQGRRLLPDVAGLSRRAGSRRDSLSGGGR